MAISTHRRRRIQIDGIQYLWWVVTDFEEEFFTQPKLTVASRDRQLLVRYCLQQSQETRYLVVLGPQFRGIPGLGGPWRRFRCPSFGDSSMLLPKDVANLVRWCTETGQATTEVDYRGHVLRMHP